MLFGGDCLALAGGRKLFVSGALPGEELEVEITKSFKDYDAARIIRVIAPSPHRAEPFCPLYGVCGGCNFQHIDGGHQIELRKTLLRESFGLEGAECPEIEVISASGRGYRSRIQLTDGGFSRRDSNEIVPLSECPVASREINSYLGSVPQDSRPRGRVHVFGDHRVSLAQGKVIVAEEDGGASGEIRLLGGVSPEKMRGLRLRRSRHFAGTPPSPRNRCEIILAGRRIAFDARGFFQSNLEVLEKTVPALTCGVGGKNLLDMYSGCGTLSVFMADFFDRVTLVEHNRAALVFAGENLSGREHESFGMSGERWIRLHADKVAAAHGDFDAVVIDPPRSGMEPAVRQWLCGSKIPLIRSLSCNPRSHARDAAALLRSGYSLTRLCLLDFYPNTSHIESLANFEYTG